MVSRKIIIIDNTSTKKNWHILKKTNKQTNMERQKDDKHKLKNATQRQMGKIDRILHNDEKGADGFIKFDGNKSIYFRVNATEEIIKKIVVGLEVEFKVLPATEDKKEKAVQLKTK